MTPAIYEPLTEMLASDIIRVKPDGYARYCEFMKYINLLVDVDNYEYFIKDNLIQNMKKWIYLCRNSR